MSMNHCLKVLDAIGEIARLVKARILIVNQFGNLPGLFSSSNLIPKEDIDEKIKAGKIDLIYLLGDLPYSRRPKVKYLVYQNAFPSTIELAPDLILPTTIWGENRGSYMGFDRKVYKNKTVATPHGYAIPHDKILSKIARGLGKIELSKFIKANGEILKLPKFDRHRMEVKVNPGEVSADKRYPYLLVQEQDQHIYSSYSLAKGLEGMSELVKPGMVQIHPADAFKNKLNEGDEVWVSSSTEKKKFQVTVRKTMEKGILYLVTPSGKTEFADNPCHVKIRR
jgi:anaerobic selenocysteine-containing dehydrogenase